MKQLVPFVQRIYDSTFARILMLQSLIIFWAMSVFAQIPEVVPVANSDLFQFIFTNFANFKGASTLVIVNLVAQILMKFIGTPLFDGLKLDSKYKFLSFGLMYFAVSITGLMIGTNMTFMEAVTSGGILLPLINYLYNVYEYFFEKKESTSSLSV